LSENDVQLLEEAWEKEGSPEMKKKRPERGGLLTGRLFRREEESGGEEKERDRHQPGISYED